jgi:hypothetical protein
MSAPKPNSADPLVAAGLPHDEVSAWLQQTPGETTDFAADRAKFSDFWQTSKRLTGRLPPKPSRSEREQLAAGLESGPVMPPSISSRSCRCRHDA